MYVEDSCKYSFSIPTISRDLFYRGIDKSRDRLKNFMESEPRGY